jgi:hypothetical protein
MSACAVILEHFRGEPLVSRALPDRGVVAAILSQHGGMPPPVANKLAERAAAIVWENASQSAAAAVAKALTAVGFPARLIAQSHVVDIAAPRRVHMLSLEGEHLGVQLKYNGPPEAVAWNDVLVISAGVFMDEKKRVVQTGTHVVNGLVVHDERVQLDLTRNILVELFAVPLSDRSALVHIRLNSHEFNYAQTFGGSIHEGWREKFSLLVAKLGLRAERALVSPITEALLAAEMMPQSCGLDPYFRSEEDFSAYNRWLLARKRAGLNA